MQDRQAYEQREQHVEVAGQEQPVRHLRHERECEQPPRVTFDARGVAIAFHQQKRHDGEGQPPYSEQHASRFDGQVGVEEVACVVERHPHDGHNFEHEGGEPCARGAEGGCRGGGRVRAGAHRFPVYCLCKMRRGERGGEVAQWARILQRSVKRSGSRKAGARRGAPSSRSLRPSRRRRDAIRLCRAGRFRSRLRRGRCWPRSRLSAWGRPIRTRYGWRRGRGRVASFVGVVPSTWADRAAGMARVRRRRRGGRGRRARGKCRKRGRLRVRWMH